VGKGGVIIQLLPASLGSTCNIAKVKIIHGDYWITGEKTGKPGVNYGSLISCEYDL